MIIILKMIAVLLVMIFLIRKRFSFGNAMLAASLLLFLLTSPKLQNLLLAFSNTFQSSGTWILILSMYLVMCLEYILRTSGLLKDFASSARKLFGGSDRALLAFMPAFLGFLPSYGGAIFSAPLVKESGARYKLTPEHNSTINYWFRHVWEFTNPILPAFLMAGQITGIHAGTLIKSQAVFTLTMILLGTTVLLTGKRFKLPAKPHISTEIKIDNTKTSNISYRSILLSAGPIFLNVLLVVIFNLNTALSMGLVVLEMIIILKFRKGDTISMLKSAFDFNILWGLAVIMFFQQILLTTGTIDQITSLFQSSGIPLEAIIGLTAFSIGLLTGSPQGFIAVTFPIIAAVSPGNLNLIAIGYVTGLAGSMSSPAHLCLLVTIEYFKADFLKTLLPVLVMEFIMVCFVYFYTMVFLPVLF
ncbi:MAG: DUF401 family protein [Eubacteriales bacterium]